MTIRLRDPGQMISYLVMPMVLMVVLKPLYIRAVRGGTVQVVTGLLVMFSVFAIAIAGSSILAERQWHTWDRLRQTRASATEMLIGKILPIFVIMLLQQIAAVRLRLRGDRGSGAGTTWAGWRWRSWSGRSRCWRWARHWQRWRAASASWV